MSVFEKEFAQNAIDLGIDKAGQTELLRKACSYCKRLAEKFSRAETASAARALAEAVLVRPFAAFNAAQVAKVYIARIQIDKESGAARSSDFADLTSDAGFSRPQKSVRESPRSSR